MIIPNNAHHYTNLPQSVMGEQFNALVCSHTSVLELWLLTMQCLNHLGNKEHIEVSTVVVFGKFHNTISCTDI